MRTLGESRGDLWTELSDKHVYYILRKLEHEGLVAVEVHSEGAGPARRVFSVTAEGLCEFERLMGADNIIESIPHSDFDVIFGMLAYTDRLTATQKSDILSRRSKRLRSIIAEATEAQKQVGDVGAPALSARVFEKVIRVATAELDWLEEVLKDVLCDGWPSGRPAQNTDTH